MTRSGVYWIRNSVNGKFYIGSAKFIVNRWSVHKATLRQNRHHSIKLQRAWNKYGEKSFTFEVLLLCDVAFIVQFEQDLITRLNAVRFGYNINSVAGSALGTKRSVETRKAISLVQLKIGADEGERLKRSERAKLQHSEGKLGQITWKRKAKYNPKSAEAGARALKEHIKNQSHEEMSRRAKMRKLVWNRWSKSYIILN